MTAMDVFYLLKNGRLPRALSYRPSFTSSSREFFANMSSIGCGFAAFFMADLPARYFGSRQENMPERCVDVVETGEQKVEVPTTPSRDYSAAAATIAGSMLLWPGSNLTGATRPLCETAIATSTANSTTMSLSTASMDKQPPLSDEDYEFLWETDAEGMVGLNGFFLPSVLSMPGYRCVPLDDSGKVSTAHEVVGGSPLSF